MIDWLEPTQKGWLVVLPHNLHVVFPSMEMTETAFLPFSLELNGRTLTATLTDDIAAEFPPLSLLPTRRRYNSRELPATHERSEATYDFATDTKRLGIGERAAQLDLFGLPTEFIDVILKQPTARAQKNEPRPPPSILARARSNQAKDWW